MEMDDWKNEDEWLLDDDKDEGHSTATSTDNNDNIEDRQWDLRYHEE